MAKYLTIISRAEAVDIIDKALQVPAKIDTGAYRSSIHVSDVKVIDKNDKKVLSFSILGHKNAPVRREMESEHFSKVRVRSSNGQEEERFEVKLKIKLANKIFITSFSLSDRSNNLYPILIGRTALEKRFIVDVAKSSIKTEPLIKEFGYTLQEFGEELD